MRKSVLSVLLLCFAAISHAQTSENQFGIKLSGFVKSDFFFDSHETVNIREGHFLLYPTRDLLDANGTVINDYPSFNFLAIQTRLTGKISGPDAFGAKTSGIIEADFFGNENASFSDLNGFRLRHAFVKLTWKKTELLAGQYWHPMFVPECFPEVISFNTGSPFQAFSRNPQMRLSHMMGHYKAILAVNSQRDFTSIGGSRELRNSALPEMNLQIHYSKKNEEKHREFISGLGYEYKVLTPRITSTKNNKVYVVDEKVSSRAFIAFMKVQNQSLSFKLHGIYGGNLSDLVMMGGYATQREMDTTTGALSYLPLDNMAFWFEGIKSFKKIDVALFAGYSQNLGASDTILTASMATKSRGSDIHSVYRIAPRVVFKSGKLRIAAELEYTAAAYNRTDITTPSINAFGAVTEYQYVSNLRALLSFIYAF
jgi:hypothetical protein